MGINEKRIDVVMHSDEIELFNRNRFRNQIRKASIPVSDLNVPNISTILDTGENVMNKDKVESTIPSKNAKSYINEVLGERQRSNESVNLLPAVDAVIDKSIAVLENTGTNILKLFNENKHDVF